MVLTLRMMTLLKRIKSLTNGTGCSNSGSPIGSARLEATRFVGNSLGAMNSLSRSGSCGSIVHCLQRVDQFFFATRKLFHHSRNIIHFVGDYLANQLTNPFEIFPLLRIH